MDKNSALQGLEKYKDELAYLSDRLWDRPETKYKEYFASEILSNYLERHGFAVQREVAGIPTAFSASYGKGSPVIGFLAEYDALDNMSQKAEATTCTPVTEGEPGHCCGHNLLGAGSIGAALLLKDYLCAGHEGTVMLFGCPAEEGGSGKTLMARDGVFDSLDVAITWHPGDTNIVMCGSCLANTQVHYHFEGKSAHAAISPEYGRSALDAVTLMNVGVQFLREHVDSDCRIHYAVTNAGGSSPNVVQKSADVLYQMRAPMLEQVLDLHKRIDDIARGAALMTGTKVEIEFVKATSNVLPNRVLSQLMQKNLEALGPADFDDDDRSLAVEMQKTMDNRNSYYKSIVELLPQGEDRTRMEAAAGSPISEEVFPLRPVEDMGFASSDVGDVSWICPTVQCTLSTMPFGTVMHSWQEVAVGKSRMAKKGMFQAALVMAATAIDCIEDPEKIRQADEELLKRTKGTPYHCPIPDSVTYKSILNSYKMN